MVATVPFLCTPLALQGVFSLEWSFRSNKTRFLRSQTGKNASHVAFLNRPHFPISTESVEYPATQGLYRNPFEIAVLRTVTGSCAPLPYGLG